MSEHPYRGGISIDALLERVDRLERVVEQMKEHRHVIRELRCPACGDNGLTISPPGLGFRCGCGQSLTAILESLENR